ncbi:MAG: hypothetical protein AAGF95_32865 [Chloroflexota bacterium]
MTNSNIITRTCVAIMIVLSILLAGGAPTGPSGLRIGDSSASQCKIGLDSSSYNLEIC